MKRPHWYLQNGLHQYETSESVEFLDGDQVATKLPRIIKGCNQEILDNVTKLCAQVQSLKKPLPTEMPSSTTCRQRSESYRMIPWSNAVVATAFASRASVGNGRRIRLRPSSASPTTCWNLVHFWAPTTSIPATSCLSRDQLKPAGPRPVIVLFVKRTDSFRVIARRANLKEYNEDMEHKIYVNEDITAFHAKLLYMTVRRLQNRETIRPDLYL